MLQTNRLTYFVTAPTSDEQRNGMKFYLEHKGYGIMVIEK
ncbi:TPA: N-acetylmuramoyl-L-alanine amidase C-terminal domain-containing protein [Bacillus cereus]|nr:N-acetylmuramoyl-L-alanine amidase C-terminal domain-containing protein [Bacillus sp. ABP14]